MSEQEQQQETRQMQGIAEQLRKAMSFDHNFTCPHCGAHEWGSSNCTQDFEKWLGHCHGYRCNFNWHRASQDELYLLSAQ